MTIRNTDDDKWTGPKTDKRNPKCTYLTGLMGPVKPRFIIARWYDFFSPPDKLGLKSLTGEVGKILSNCMDTTDLTGSVNKEADNFFSPLKSQPNLQTFSYN